MRSIPAHAGKTDGRHAATACPREHPRSRGENHIAKGGFDAALGTPPLTRGKQQPKLLVAHFLRNIPAHAGKTRPALYSPLSSEQHPRSRGENTLGYEVVDWIEKTSPLTRGKHTSSPAKFGSQCRILYHSERRACRARRRLAGFDHPGFNPTSPLVLFLNGRRISDNPSTSTTSQSWRCTL